MIATASEIKTQQKRTYESITDCICLIVSWFQRQMISFCEIWKHFTGLISGYIPHSTPTPWQEKIQVHISPHISVVMKLSIRSERMSNLCQGTEFRPQSPWVPVPMFIDTILGVC